MTALLLTLGISLTVTSRGAILPAPQVITWLYTKNLQKASSWLDDVVGLPVAFEGGSHPAAGYSDCKIHRGSSTEFFLGVCDIRDPPTSMTEASVTVTLVAENGRSGVDEWYKHLISKGSSRVNVTEPSHSVKFNCYAFNFFDVDNDSLGFYRFEVQIFEDPVWPKPTSSSMVGRTPPAPQQVTWFYTQDLPGSTAFLQEELHFPLVLDQGPCTIHSHPRSNSYFLGVCNSRPAPAETPPVMYSLVVPSASDVRDWHKLLSKNATVSQPREVPKYEIFAFTFADNHKSRLGWYQFECLHMENPSWPHPSNVVVV